jgi:hypothetical protein
MVVLARRLEVDRSNCTKDEIAELQAACLIEQADVRAANSHRDR